VQERIAAGEIDAEIAVVFCDRERGEAENTDAFLDLVEGYGIPLVTLSYREFRRSRGLPPALKEGPLPEWRRDYDRKIIEALRPYGFDIGVLAGYMLVASDLLCERYDLLNLHPAAPGGPKGLWQDVIWQLIEQRAERAGVMMHLATPELDAGPPVAFCLYPIRGPGFDPLWSEIEGRALAEARPDEGEDNALFREIRRQGIARELPLVVEMIRSFAAGELRIVRKRVVDATGKPVPGRDLSDRIEAAIAAGGMSEGA
jgi:folate-dependent phosphoribosylglycinamide formyltransferase PurN